MLFKVLSDKIFQIHSTAMLSRSVNVYIPHLKSKVRFNTLIF